MGMFDYVNYKENCPKCGALVDNFQSKDLDCNLDTLERWQVNNYYSVCDKCGEWIEYNIENLPEWAQDYIKELKDLIREV